MHPLAPHQSPEVHGDRVNLPAVAPFIADLTRRVGLSRRAKATALCRGVLLGLYRISQGEGEFLDGRALASRS